MTTIKTTTLLGPDDKLLSMSDDGQFLSFVETSGGDQSLYVLDVNSGQRSLIDTFSGSTSDTGIDGGILSPNGEFIFYSTGLIGGDSANANGEVHFFEKDLQSDTPPIDVTPQVPQTPAPGIELALLPEAISDDGLTIVYGEEYTDFTDANPDFGGSIVENLVTGGQQAFAGGASDPGLEVQIRDARLTPDGRYLSYDDNAAFHVEDLQSGTELKSVGGDVGGGSVSDDGRYIVYEQPVNANGQADLSGTSQLFVHDNDASPSAPDKIIPTSALWDPIDPGATFQALSGDGRHVVFSVEANGGSAASYYVEDLDTDAVKLLEADAPFDQTILISNDGSRIVLGDSGGATLNQVQAPTLNIDAITGDDFVDAADGSNITISGTSDASDGQTVIVTLPAEPGQSNTSSATVHNGTWSTTIDVGKLADGIADVHATVIDDDKLTGATDHFFIIDRTPPVATITSIAGDNIINAAELSHATVDGTVLIADPAGPGSDVGTLQLQIDGGTSSTTFDSQTSPTADPQSFSHDLDAAGVTDGEHTVTLTVTDEAGNETVVTQKVLVDTTPPKIAITSVSGDDVVSSTEINSAQGVHGTSDAIGQTVDVLIDGFEAGQAVVQADGTWISTINFAGFPSGDFDVSAQVSDEAGNVGQSDVDVYVDPGVSIKDLTFDPHGSNVLFPSLSADGTKLVFTGVNFDLNGPPSDSSAQVYFEDTTTGATSAVTLGPVDNSEFGAISPDGSKIVFVSNAALDPGNQAVNGDGATYYTYEENLSDGIPHIRGVGSPSPDVLNPQLPAGEQLQQPLPVFPLAIANNGYDSEMVGTFTVDSSTGTVGVSENFVVDASVDASGQPTSPGNQLETLTPTLPPGNSGTFQAYAPQFSADGSVVAFEGRFHAEQPTGAQPGPDTQIYAGSDTSTNVIALVSSFADGMEMPFGAVDPALSSDGKFVAFWSWGLDGAPEVFVKNLATGELKIASSDANGNPGVDNASGTFNAGFGTIAISADGRYVAFTSDAVLTPADTSGNPFFPGDLFVKDMQTGAIQRIELQTDSIPTDLSAQLAISADGQFIAFVTRASLGVDGDGDTNGSPDIYGIALSSGATQIVIDAVTGDDRINAAEATKQVAVTGTSDAIGQTVTLVVDGNVQAGVVVAADGTWSTTIDATKLVDGAHQFRATVTNVEGATDSDGDLVTVDRIAPTLVLSADKAHIAAGQTATITATFSEGIGSLGANFLSAIGGVLSQQQFVNDHTLTAIFTPNAGANSFTIKANPDSAFDFAGNGNTAGSSLTVGAAFEGYIVGGTVSYANGSGNGVTATTDAEGGFVLTGGNGPLLMTGGTDSATGLAFTGTFEAPDGSTVLSPLTTLIEKVIEANPADSVAQANDAVVSALGLPAGADLTSLDAVAGTLAGDATSTAAFKAGSELLDAITLIQAAGGSPDAAYAAIAADAAAGSAVDLTDAATIEAIGQSAGLGTAAAQAVASIVSATDAALEQQLAGATTPLEVFIDITGAGIAEQGDAVFALSHPGGDTPQQVADSYVQSLGTTLSHDDLIAAQNVACYCPGTLIATDRGDVAVEDLRIDDGVVVLSGSVRPIKWIGKRSYAGRFVFGQKDILPVCFKAGSLADNVPRRDLWISPHHAMYFKDKNLEGVLVEARDLVNGVSIVQAEQVDKVEYFHIELDSHDVIVAEGAWSETFVDIDSRGMFQNAHEYHALYPDAEGGAGRYFAPRCADGYEVEAVRRRIDVRAGLRPAVSETTATLRGYVDIVSVSVYRIAGWAQNPAHPEAPVCLDIIADGCLIGRTLANRHRDDLARAGIGSGRHGFEFTPPSKLAVAPSTIEVRRSSDGALLAFSSSSELAILKRALQNAA